MNSLSYGHIVHVLRLLQSYTGDKGNYCLFFNEHRTNYLTAEDHYEDTLSDCVVGELDDNFVVELHWYKDTPIGNYKIVTSDTRELVKMVEEVINEQR